MSRISRTIANLPRIISAVIQDTLRAIAHANRPSNRRPPLHPWLQSSSARYYNLKQIDIRVPPGLSAVHQQWNAGKKVLVTIAPDYNLANDYPDGGEPPMPDSGEQTAKQEFYEFLGSALASVVKAEAIAAQETVNFILKAGCKGEKEPYEVRMVVFEYPTRDAEGRVVLRPIQIPLLSLLPIPMLQIRDAKLDFDVEVVQGHSRLSRPDKVVRGTEDNNDNDVPLQVVLPLSASSKLIRNEAQPTNQQDSQPAEISHSWNAPLADRVLDDTFNDGRGSNTYRGLHMGVSITVERSDMPDGIRNLLYVVNNKVVLEPTSSNGNRPVSTL